METTYKVTDRMTSCMAMTHHIQMRIASALVRGRVSDVVVRDIEQMCESIVDAFKSSKND